MDRAGWGLAPHGRAVMLAALASPGLLAAQEPSPPEHPPPEVCEAGPTLTYLANSAVLIRGAHSVLIDAPFTDGVEPYPKLSAETLRRARSAEPPEGEPIVANDRAPRIEVLALHHGRRRAVTNLGFLVEVDGVRVLHVGDAEVTVPDIAPLGLSERDIDVALMPTWYARNDEFRPVLDAVGAGHVLLMHFPERRAGDRLFRRSGGWDAVLRSAAESDPPLVPLIRRSRTYCLDPFTATSADAGSTEP